MQVRNRNLTLKDIEFIAGVGSFGTLGQVARSINKPSDLEITLATECLFYRGWLEKIEIVLREKRRDPELFKHIQDCLEDLQHGDDPHTHRIDERDKK